MHSNYLRYQGFILLTFLVYMPQASDQLECYVCQNQPDNKNKCAETVKICDLSQDQCLTEVRWGSTPFWSLTEQKQHFISKRCATKLDCQEAINDRFHKCDRIWYNDWNCTTCCSGDKCNYFVTLAGQSVRPTDFLILFIGVLTSFITYYQASNHRY